jgi:predicted transcriptional regulator
MSIVRINILAGTPEKERFQVFMNKNAALLEMLSGNGAFSTGQQEDSLMQATSSIVSAFLSKNPCAVQELPQLVAQTLKALQGHNAEAFAQAGKAGLNSAGEQAAQQEVKLQPAVDPRKSVQQDYIVCLEDGKKMKMLKRYLANKYNLTPQQYREKWGLAKDYPMVAPAYAEERAQVAKRIGLGQQNTGRRKKLVR